jgi:osmoprotectant transport system permease protein
VRELARYLVDHRAEVGTALGQHVVLVAIAVAIAVAIGLPLGVLATRRRAFERVVLGTASVLQTIPSLALFGFLIPLPLLGGVGARPAAVALTLYALLPIARNTHAGIRALDPSLLEAGRGMGMTDRQLLLRVELPLAAGVILAGVRVAAVVSIGVATIAAAIGAGGLGVFIFRGIAMVDNVVILAGALPAAALALVTDGLLGLIERRLRVPGAAQPGTARGRAAASGPA